MTAEPARQDAAVVSTWRFGLSANAEAWRVLESGGTALDAVVAGVAVAERDPDVKSVGFGGYPNAEGVVEVDAAVMDGRTLGYGAVAGLRGVVHPTAVARCVMEHSPHVMLVGAGASAFAKTRGFPEETLLTDRARDAWEAWKAGRSGRPTDAHDTIGALALDASGDLAAACTTSGQAFKLPGRVGDSPLIGSGLYADNEVGAAAATGQGEEIVRVCGSFLIVELMRAGRTPQAACEAAVQRLINRVPTSRAFQMAFIALDRQGNCGGAAARGDFVYAVTSVRENRLRSAPSFVA
jgi:isoaspartyl peptidase/L-asparaginase-like protein (Ntn-hydrolase superfamily)